jgi:hypothetical protein
MNTGCEALLSEQRMVAAGLREWVATVPGEEADLTRAAVELVIEAFDGGLADPSWPWVREGDELGMFWLDPEPMARFDGQGGELRLLPLVEALLGGRRVTGLVQLLTALNPATAELVLVTFARASRSRRDVALYAFGGDPWAVYGWLTSGKLHHHGSVPVEPSAPSLVGRWGS